MSSAQNKSPILLFIGSFLSLQSGSLCVSEKLSGKLREYGLQVELISRKRNKLNRIIDIITSLLFSEANLVHIDVYSGQAFMITEIATFICKMLGKKMILTLHGGALLVFYPNNKKRIHRAFNRAAIITTPSQMLQQFFEGKGFMTQYIPNSVELSHFPFNRSSVRPFSLLWVRAFDPIYNPQLAVRTLAIVREKYPAATLTMIGPDKGVLHETMQVVREYYLEPHVHVTGPISNRKLYKYYQTHEVFLNTTSYESFGVAVLEAAACGIPVVSSKSGEIPYLWAHEENIMIVPELDAKFFAEQVLRLFDDPKLAQKLSINARKKAEQFDWDVIKPMWLKIFGNCG